MRDERPIVDGLPMEPIGKLTKGGARSLPGLRVAMGLHEALRQISDADALKRSTPAEFAEVQAVCRPS